MSAAQAVIDHRQQAVGIRWQIDAHDLGLLVDDVVDKSGVLMGEAVVVLAPDVRGQQVVQRGDLPPPGQMRGDFQPLRVLVEHRIDDVDECLVAIEKSVPPGEQVAFQPAFALVLAEHFHHARRLGARNSSFGSVAASHWRWVTSKSRFQTVREGLVGTKETEIPLLAVELHHIAQETSEHVRVADAGNARCRHFNGIVAEIRHAQIP